MKIAECTNCGAKFDVSPYKPGSKLRCARCKGVFVVPDVPATATAATANAPAAGKKSAEDSFFPEDSESPQHDWNKAPAGADDDSAPAAAPAARTTKQPTRSFPRPAADSGGSGPVRRPGAGAGGIGSGTRSFKRPAGAALAGARAGDDDEDDRGRGRKGGGKPGAGSPMIAVGSVLTMVLAVGMIFWIMRSPDKNGPGGTSGSGGAGGQPTEETYEAKKAKTNMTDTTSILTLAGWCEQKGMVKERDELYEAAWLLDKKGMTERMRALFFSKMQSIPGDDANANFALVEWADKHGLEKEAETLTDKILKINKNHAGANKRRGLVLYEGKWEPADMVAILAESQKKFKDEQEMLSKMKPREKDVYLKKKELKSEFSEANGWPDIEFLEAQPYLLCLQKSKKYAADIRLSDFSEIVSHLFTAFYKMYAEKFELTDMKDSLVIVFVFEDREAYMKYGQTIGIPPYAGGHYEQGGKKRLMIYNDVSDPYETIFHEGMHQLVDFATMSKGKKDKNMFWFTEGVATYFENFKRDPKEGFILGEISRGKYLPIIKQALRHKMMVPLKDLIQREYGAVVQEAMQDKTGNKIQIYYAESWSLTHFFYKHDGGKYKEKFEAYFKKEVYGEGGVDAFKEVFGDPAALQEEWMKYVQELQ